MDEDDTDTDANVTGLPGEVTPENAPSQEAQQESQQKAEPDIAELQRQIDAANKAKEAAEKALNLERSAHSKTKREHMTAAELLTEQQKEAEEAAHSYKRQMSALSAERIFASAGLQNDDYSGLLEVIVGEDAGKTESAAKAIIALVSRREQLAAKAEREKLIKDTPPPPGGDDGGQTNSGIKAAQELGKQAAQASAASNDILKHYIGG